MRGIVSRYDSDMTQIWLMSVDRIAINRIAPKAPGFAYIFSTFGASILLSRDEARQSQVQPLRGAAVLAKPKIDLAFFIHPSGYCVYRESGLMRRIASH